MECDTYLGNWPAVGTPTSNGAKFYEVLTSDSNLQWVKANTFSTDQEIEDNMVITGTHAGEAGNNKNPLKERVFHGLCR